MLDFDKLLGNRVKNSNYAFSNGLGILIESEKFNGCSLKRTYLKDSTIKKSSFFQCAFTGSRFDKTLFKKSSFHYVNFQFSTFQNCHFKNLSKKNLLLGNNYDHCYFYRVNFRNVEFNGCSISCSYFVNCIFEKCTFFATTLECTVFEKCTFSDVKMAELNIEYSQFRDCTLNQVYFPFTQLPYVIGFSKFEKDANIIVVADNTSLEFNKYQMYFDNLVDYYNGLNEKFPIANILLFQGKASEAYSILREEVQSCLLKSDYRVIKHICRLITYNTDILPSKAKELFDIVKASIDKIDTPNQTLECLNNIDEIRRLTMNAKYNKTALKIIVETDIPSDDLDSISAIIKTIETTIAQSIPDSYSKSIEIRHNSPYELFVQLCQNKQEIEAVLTAIGNVLPVVDAGLSIIAMSLSLKDRVKKAWKKTDRTKSHITKITVIIE